MIKNQEEEINNPIILIVDDVPKNLQVLGTILKKKNYKVSALNNGKQAIEMVNKINPDLILLDIMMPDMNGFEVCEILKNSDTTKDIPVIFLTAKSDDEDIVNGFELGAVDYVKKPFSSAELLARVKTHIQLKRMRESLEIKNKYLEESLLHIKRLEGFLPICSNCKKIREKNSDPSKNSSWINLENYIGDNSEAEFTHSICPDCSDGLYSELANFKSQ